MAYQVRSSPQSAVTVPLIRMIEAVVRGLVRPQRREITTAAGTRITVMAGEALPSPKLEEITADMLPLRESRSHPKARHFRVKMPSTEYAYFGCTPGTGWVDVYARNRRSGESGGNFTGPYAMHGYHISGRWAYGNGPPAAGDLRGHVAQLAMRGLA